MKHLEKNWLEWCVFGAGSLLVLATVTYLAYEAATATARPAHLNVRLRGSEQRRGEFAVPVTVVNSGDKSAETVLVEVLLLSESGREERAELQFQFVPGGATRDGWAFFEGDPSKGKLSARALGFQSP